MKKFGLCIFFVLLTFACAFTAEAWVWDADYPYSPDDSTVYDRFDWDMWNHLAITWNDTTVTASAIQMDPDGVPNLYYWADIYSGANPNVIYMYLYFSDDGFNWYEAGLYEYY